MEGLARARVEAAERTEAFLIAEAAKSVPTIPAKRSRRPTVYHAPEEQLRDHRRTAASAKQGPVGTHRELSFKKEQSVDAASKAAAEYKAKLRVARSGSKVFGPLDLLMFEKKANKRFGDILPEMLEDVDGAEGMLQHCKPVLDVVFAFVEHCFVEYEKTIDLLQRRIKTLERTGSAPIPVLSAKKGVTQYDAQSRKTLYRHATSVKECIRNHAGQCDVKALTLAREVVRLLSPSASATAVRLIFFIPPLF